MAVVAVVALESPVALEFLELLEEFLLWYERKSHTAFLNLVKVFRKCCEESYEIPIEFL